MTIRIARIVLLAGLAALLIRTAWMSDDAYITLRTIDNFVHGFGLRWNVDERVQTYTHPLWMLTLTPFYWLTRDAYFTPIAVSIVVTLATIARLVRIAPSDRTVVVSLLALALSRAFVDFSTSGLENPLTNLLLVCFAAEYVRAGRSVVALTLLLSLLLVNRMDSALLVMPAWIVALPRRRDMRAYAGIALALTPFVAWELFSLTYYGFLVPNTAYAKLHTGIPAQDLVPQGFKYLLDSIRRDPLTLLTVGTAAAVGWQRSTLRPLAVGLAVYLAYVLWIGGDFMSGRLLAAPFVLGVAILASADFAAWAAPAWALTAIVVFVGVTAARASIFAAGDDGGPRLITNGIADERLFYYDDCSLVNYTPSAGWPSHTFAIKGRDARDAHVVSYVYCCVGMLGYFAGPDVRVVDTMALADPLLARLPSVTPWRIGHFERDVPPGYVRSVATGTNQIGDPKLAAYYEQLRLITRGPLWSRARLAAILSMNVGRFEPLIAGYWKKS